jgi:hypothetical protein
VTYERGARLITGSTYLPGWTTPNRATTVTSGQQVAQEIHTGMPK